MKHLGDVRNTAGWFNRPNEGTPEGKFTVATWFATYDPVTFCAELPLWLYLTSDTGHSGGVLRRAGFIPVLIFSLVGCSHRPEKHLARLEEGHHEWLFWLRPMSSHEAGRLHVDAVTWSRGRGTGFIKKRWGHLLRGELRGSVGRGKGLKTLPEPLICWPKNLINVENVLSQTVIHSWFSISYHSLATQHPQAFTDGLFLRPESWERSKWLHHHQPGNGHVNQWFQKY